MAKKARLDLELERFYQTLAGYAEMVPRDQLSLHAHMKSNTALARTHEALISGKKTVHACARDCHREAEFLHRKAAGELPTHGEDHTTCANVHGQLVDYHISVIG